jgi:ATP-binding cassette subfamily B protein
VWADKPSAKTVVSTALGPERYRVVGLVTLLLAGSGISLATPILIGRIVDRAMAQAPMSDLILLALTYLALVITSESSKLLTIRTSTDVSWRAGNRLRERLAEHIYRLDLGWHERHTPGELISRVDGDVIALTSLFSTIIVTVIGNGVIAVGVIVVTLAFDWRIGLVTVTSACVAIAVMSRAREWAVPANTAEREAAAGLYSDLEERLGGLEDLRANGAGDHVVNRVHVHAAGLWRINREANLRGNLGLALAATALALGSIATLGVSALLYRQGSISIGTVLVLFRYSQIVREPLDQIARQIPEFQLALSGARRASQVLAERPSLDAPPGGGVRALPPGPLGVDFDDVTLCYKRGDTPALQGVTFHLPPGATLGVLGRTGSGKTTLARLLARFWAPTAGTVRVGGVDLRCVTNEELRRRIMIATQDMELLRASIRDNLTLFGAVAASNDRLESVLRDVGLGDWLGLMPDGIDSMLDGHVGMSAGQAQLFTLARALLSDADIVILDEPSSRIDAVTSTYLSESLDRLLCGRTVVIIAHRLSTLQRVTKIAIIDSGKLVEFGDRSALVADERSRFSRLLSMSKEADAPN